MGRLTLALLLAISSAHAQSTITTVVGGPWVYRTEGEPAANVPISSLSWLAVDSTGNLFATDPPSNVVLKINPAGILTPAAGTGLAGFSGDGGPATQALLSAPTAIAVDTAGALYVTDARNNRVRKISPAGTITTFAGNGQSGLSGDGGPATAASFGSLSGVAVDGTGNVYIVDGSFLRRVTPDGIISTVAAGFSKNPVMDPAGNFYAASTTEHCVRQRRTDGTWAAVVGVCKVDYVCPSFSPHNPPCQSVYNSGFSGDGGPATTAKLSGPTGVWVDSAGNLFIADTRNNRIRKVDTKGIINTIAGNGTRSFSGDGGRAMTAALDQPSAVAVDNAGTIYFTDSGYVNQRIRKVDPNGIIATLAGPNFGGDGRPATQARIVRPFGLAFDAAGNMYISDSGNYRVRKIDRNGIASTVAGNGMQADSGDGGPATAASLVEPHGLAVDAAGNLYVADSYAHKVRKVSPHGVITTFAGTGSCGAPGEGRPATEATLCEPQAVAVDRSGNVYVTDMRYAASDDRIWRIGPDGTFTSFAAGLRAFRLTTDSEANIYTGSRFYGPVYKINASGTITRFAGNGPGFSGDGGSALDATFNMLFGLAADHFGNVYLADRENARIRKVRPDGIITTAAGNGYHRQPGAGYGGYSGDGGPSTAAALDLPCDVAIDPAGNLYIADTYNDRIRKVTGGQPEPFIRTTLQPGFYIAEVRLATGEREGYWGMEVQMPKGVLAGGFNLGGAVQGCNSPPGFGAFYVPTRQAVHVRLDAQALPGTDPSQLSLMARLLDSSRIPVGTERMGGNSIEFDEVLDAGFYILEVRGGCGSPRATFQLGLNSDPFVGGVNAGGFIDVGLVAFGAFYVLETQEVAIRVFGRPSYAQDGAGLMHVRLLDAARNALASSQP